MSWIAPSRHAAIDSRQARSSAGRSCVRMRVVIFGSSILSLRRDGRPRIRTVLSAGAGAAGPAIPSKRRSIAEGSRRAIHGRGRRAGVPGRDRG